jgi:putative ABC transport system permease protein
MIWPVASSAMQQGLLFALAIYGIVISFRMLNFPDLTVDGSFTLGAAVCAVALVSGHNPVVAMFFAAIAGFLAGTGTVILHRKLGISKLLSGILAMMVLYSINLRIMGRANISLLTTSNIMSPLESLGINSPAYLAGLAIFPVIVLIICGYIAATHLGLFMRATGDNEFMVRGLGVNTDWPVFLGLGFSNMLVAICGALVAQSQGFADVSMGIGLIITGLAALIIGETAMDGLTAIKRIIWRQHSRSRFVLLPWDTFKQLGGALLGGLLYFLAIGICLRIGLAPTDLKLGTGALVIIGIALRLKGADVENYAKANW